MSDSVSLMFTEINASRDGELVAAFLSANCWPFHARSKLTLDQARTIPLGPPEETRAFWIEQHHSPVGIIRAFDLQDAVEGSVLFDLRIAEAFRGRGIGRAAVDWLVQMLFREYPALHRIDATTRIDNHPMRRVLEMNHFVLEGCLRQTWRSDSGVRYDTAMYGRLRSDGLERSR